ncbi:unnamed protein product [Onchocerca ochengi]|uniref:Uncharacterized protein n=1 Tax=Onchocerca ochengi TaxID=42157 RepID=A0A182EKZ4_ONCOC|nr:unnamed protein product [Onchocerca ochengi]
MDGHDITARILRQKLKSLMDFMVIAWQSCASSSNTHVDADEVVNYLTEYLDSFDLSGMPSQVPQLKIDCQSSCCKISTSQNFTIVRSLL